MTHLNREQLANLAVLLVLMVITGWYLWDTWRASGHIFNLIFVLPLTVTILALCAFAFVRDLLNPPDLAPAATAAGDSPVAAADSTGSLDVDQADSETESEVNSKTDSETDSETGSEGESLLVILLFVGYVITLPWLGFDVGTFLFLALFLKLAGEQKWQWILGYSLAFALGAALFFSMMLPYAMPLLLLPGID